MTPAKAEKAMEAVKGKSADIMAAREALAEKPSYDAAVVIQRFERERHVLRSKLPPIRVVADNPEINLTVDEQNAHREHVIPRLLTYRGGRA